MDHMNSEEKLAITKLIQEYKNIFHTDNESLSFTNEIKLPIYTKTYRYPDIHRLEVKEQIDKMLR